MSTRNSLFLIGNNHVYGECYEDVYDDLGIHRGYHIYCDFSIHAELDTDGNDIVFTVDPDRYSPETIGRSERYIEDGKIIIPKADIINWECDRYETSFELIDLSPTWIKWMSVDKDSLMNFKDKDDVYTFNMRPYNKELPEDEKNGLSIDIQKTLNKSWINTKPIKIVDGDNIYEISTIERVKKLMNDTISSFNDLISHCDKEKK